MIFDSTALSEKSLIVSAISERALLLVGTRSNSSRIITTGLGNVRTSNRTSFGCPTSTFIDCGGWMLPPNAAWRSATLTSWKTRSQIDANVSDDVQET